MEVAGHSWDFRCWMMTSEMGTPPVEAISSGGLHSGISKNTNRSRSTQSSSRPTLQSQKPVPIPAFNTSDVVRVSKVATEVSKH